jgi:hypothetical protein
MNNNNLKKDPVKDSSEPRYEPSPEFHHASTLILDF